MKLTREIKTGIIVIAGIALFILGFSYLKSSSLFDNQIKLHAVYDNIAGLQTGSSVSMKGRNIGKVGQIQFINDNRQLLVTFSVTNNIKFSKNSIAELFGADPLGGMALQVVQVYDNAAHATDNDTLPSRKMMGLLDKLDPSLQNIDGALISADSLLTNLNGFLDEPTKDQFKLGVSDINRLITDLRQSTNAINRLLDQNQDKFNRSMAQIDEMTANFAEVSKALKDADLSKTMKNLGTSVENLNNLMAKIDRGEGTLGKLANDEALYTNLESAMRELDLLLQDFRLNPKRYVNVSVFGKKQKDYTLPENDPAETKNQE